jgi:hypothetical protein
MGWMGIMGLLGWMGLMERMGLMGLVEEYCLPEYNGLAPSF